ncbi:MAG: hypothetical protein KC584_06470 [Nitrospira sp.]|nr:hypothetical protein [Nitrospira sp.]
MNGEEAVIKAYGHAINKACDAYVKREDRGDRIVVRTSGVCESRLPDQAGGTEPVKKLTHLDHAMVVAMSTVWKMQMAVNQIVDMIAVGNQLMPTCRSMAMGGLMCLAIVVGRTSGGIRCPYS